MSRTRYQRYLLPATLGILGLLLLIRVFLVDTLILLPEDTDVVLLVVVLSIAIVLAIHSLVRLAMNFLRLRSVRRARRETLAEHRRFLQRLDHELKNPLTTLRTGLKTLALTDITPQQQQLIETMETEALRLSRLVTDLRKLAELEVQPLEIQPVDIEALLHQIVRLEQEKFAAGERTLTTEISGLRNTWTLDEDLFALAVHNVLDNAYKYTQPGASVHVEVVTQHDEFILRVRDTGTGIPPEVLPFVWEELYRANPLEKIPGSGIGLALVKAIIERHNGMVVIDSTPGEGTTVSLHLPLISQD